MNVPPEHHDEIRHKTEILCTNLQISLRPTPLINAWTWNCGKEWCRYVQRDFCHTKRNHQLDILEQWFSSRTAQSDYNYVYCDLFAFRLSSSIYCTCFSRGLWEVLLKSYGTNMVINIYKSKEWIVVKATPMASNLDFWMLSQKANFSLSFFALQHESAGKRKLSGKNEMGVIVRTLVEKGTKICEVLCSNQSKPSWHVLRTQ